MKERGLGTPATRAVIIEKLIAEEYVLRNQRELQPTPKAFSLFTLLRGLEIPELTSPELTGEWEYKLKEMEHGKLSRDQFMQGIADMTRHIVERAKAHESDTVPGDYTTLKTPCPKCGGVIKENYKKFQCQNCDFALWRILSGRQFEPAEIEELIEKAPDRAAAGFSQPAGQAFRGDHQAHARNSRSSSISASSKDADGEAMDFSAQESLGPCPKCGGRVFAHGMAYVCENAVATPRSCDFRSGKIILQRPIEPEQMKKLLTEGKTDLLHRFISKKGRPFSAFLVKGPDGKVGFEFAPRARKRRRRPKRRQRPKAPPKARKTELVASKAAKRSLDRRRKGGYGGKPWVSLCSFTGRHRRLGCRGQLNVDVSRARARCFR